MDLMEGGSDGLELSLKLYHLGELQLAHQQLMTEAPNCAWIVGVWQSSDVIPFLSIIPNRHVIPLKKSEC